MTDTHSPWHITITSEGRHPMFPDTGLLRRAVRALCRVSGEHTALFCIVDDHAHQSAYGTEEEIAVCANSLWQALSHLAVVPLVPPHIKPVADRRHMETLVGYTLDQTSHHGIPVHPALWDGNCFLDLVRARLVDGFGNRVRDVLPRFRLRQAYAAVGLEPVPAALLTVDELAACGVRRIVEAAWAALALEPPPTKRSKARLQARRAVVYLARQAGLSMAEVARELRLSMRAVHDLAATPPPAQVVQATLLRLAIEDRVDLAYRKAYRELRELREREKRRRRGCG